MALLMLNTIKITRLVNVFYSITTKHEMSNDSLWPPRGRSSSIRVQTKPVTFVRGDCRGGCVANTGVGTRAVRRRLRPLCGAFPGWQPGSSQLSQHTWETLPCVFCPTPDQATETTQQIISTQRLCSLRSTSTGCCLQKWGRQKDRELQTSLPWEAHFPVGSLLGFVCHRSKNAKTIMLIIVQKCWSDGWEDTFIIYTAMFCSL